MTPDQLARVLSAGEPHVHDPHTRAAINAMIGECHRIEDEQAVRLIEAPAARTPAQMEELARVARKLTSAHLPYDYQADVDALLGSNYAVARADRSVHVAFHDVAAAENFEQWMRAGDWDEFLRWQRASRDTAPQFTLSEHMDAYTPDGRYKGHQVPTDVAAAYGSRVERFGTDEDAGQPVDTPTVVTKPDIYSKEFTDRVAKVAAEQATAPYARGLPDEPMEPSQYALAPHQFVPREDEPFFCKVPGCGGSHFSTLHDS